MIVRLEAGESLTAVLSAAASTTNPVYLVTSRDESKSYQAVGSLSGATAVTLLTTPPGIREVDSVHVNNLDTAVVTLTLAKVSAAGTSYSLHVVTLSSGSSLLWSADGLKVTDSQGRSLDSAPASLVTGVAAGTGVTAAEQALDDTWNRTTLTLVDTPVVLADEAGVVAYGGLKVYDMPRGVIAVNSVSVSCAVAKTSAGVNDDYDGDFGMGTVTATNNSTLTTTEANLVASTATAQAVAGATTASGSMTVPLLIDGGSTPMDVYVNALVDDADHDVTSTACNLEFTGTIEFVWAYLGP